MKILFVTPRLPYPPDRGDRVRVYNFARVLSKKHSLFLLSFIQSREELKNVEELETIFDETTTILLKPWKSNLNMLTHFFSRLPHQVFYYNSDVMRRKVRQVIEEEKIDVVYTFHLRMAPHTIDLKDIYKILDLTDSVSLFLRRMLPFSRIYLKPLLYSEWLKVRRYEPMITERFDECWLISKTDKRAIEEASCPSNLVIVPNGIDLDYFKRDGLELDSQYLLFVGYMGAESVDSVFYFYNKIFPLIKKEVPSAQFYIVGASPPRKVTKLAQDKDVIVTGFVKDLRSYYQKAAVMVAPMRFVAGVQNKILEAMAMGVPVVTSRFGNEGIDAQPEKEIFVENNPESFARSVIELLKNEDLRRKIGANARKFVERNFTWRKVFDRMDKIWEKISDNRLNIA